MPTLSERIAVLEQKAVESKNNDIEILKAIDELRKEIKSNTADLNRYRGMFGFAVFLISCLSAFFTALPFFKK